MKKEYIDIIIDALDKAMERERKGVSSNSLLAIRTSTKRMLEFLQKENIKPDKRISIIVNMLEQLDTYMEKEETDEKH